MSSIINPLNFPGVEAGLSEEQRAFFDKASSDALELAQAFNRLFNTDDGKKVIQHLREMTIENSTWCASLGLEKAVPHGFAREGQNSLVKYIEDMARKAPISKAEGIQNDRGKPEST